jgi:hypothetical protein
LETSIPWEGTEDEKLIPALNFFFFLSDLFRNQVPNCNIMMRLELQFRQQIQKNTNPVCHTEWGIPSADIQLSPPSSLASRQCST